MNWTIPPIDPPCPLFREQARARQSQLTKPPGSLGLLEDLAVRLAAMQRKSLPTVDRIWISVFAADHGIAEEGVSAFSQAVTAMMVRNFVRGGAAISVLARQFGARLEVVDVGVIEPATDCPGVISSPVGKGTANFAKGPAMAADQLDSALAIGSMAACRAFEHGTEIFVGGEMGIANTTSATALACALLDADPTRMVGPGTGLDAAGVAHKRAVVAAALEFHSATLRDPREILRRLGGFEIAALAGSYLQAAALGVPSLVDGFIASVAALIAVRLQPACHDWLIFAHRSAEPGHRSVLDALDARPLLDLSMRLGEGSGAALALPILQAACTLHAAMATFAEAEIPCR